MIKDICVNVIIICFSNLTFGNGSFYIGGVPSLDVISTNHVSSFDFLGCMRGIFINGVMVDVNIVASKYRVMNRCPRVSSGCMKGFCHHESTCIDKWFDTLCRCTNVNYYGVKCDQGKLSIINFY